MNRTYHKELLNRFDDFTMGNVGEQAGIIQGAHKDIRVDVKILHGLIKCK